HLLEAGAGEIGEIVTLADLHAPALEDLAISSGPDEADGFIERVQRLDPSLSAGSDIIPALGRQSNARKLRLDRFGGPRSVGDQHDAAALIAPLLQPLRSSGIEVHAIVHDAPDVAQDQPVLGVERVPKAHSRPAAASASSIGATSSGLLSS